MKMSRTVAKAWARLEKGEQLKAWLNFEQEPTTIIFEPARDQYVLSATLNKWIAEGKIVEIQSAVWPGRRDLKEWIVYGINKNP